MAKDKFIIEPHFRLHEWVAEEKGYFKDEGLDYEFRELVQSSDGASQQLGDKVGAMQTFERGRKSDISCACHWTVNVAATKGHGKLYGDVYQVSTCGIFVPPDSKVKTPEDLAGVPISVGYQSGSHYATIQALEQFMPQDKINLSFKDGLVFGRMEKLLNGEVPACTLFSGPYYFAEQLGFRKVVDCTFMMATMLTGDPDMEDVQKFFRALGGRRPTSICGRSSTPSTTRRSSPSASTTRWIRAAGGRASASCSSRIPAKFSRTRAPGSPSTASSRATISARKAYDNAVVRLTA